METVISEDAARAEIQGWCDRFEKELVEIEIKALLPPVMRGRVLFDEGKEEFTITLKAPIDIGSGQTMSVLKLREPNIGEVQDASKNKADEMTIALKLTSKLSGQPLGIIQRLKPRDIRVITGLFTFFV